MNFSLAIDSLNPGGGSAPFNPGLLPGLALWLRSDLGVTQSGGTVSAWADQSGHGRNVAQSTTSKQPAYSASGGPNNQAHLDFNFSNAQVLSTAASPGLPSGDLVCTVFIVATDTLAGLAGNGLYQWGNTGAGGAAFGLTTDVRGTDVLSIECSGNTPAIFQSTTTAAHIYTVTKAAGALNAGTSLYLDGTAQTIQGGSSSSTLNVDPTGALNVGWWNGIGFFGGSIMELVICSGVLSGANLTATHHYMGTRYSITVP